MARENLARWSQRNADASSLIACYAAAGASVGVDLQQTLRRTAEGQRLRQNSPFAGVLTPAEIWAIKAADAAWLPQGWRERLVPVTNANTGSGMELCLEIHDLAVSKLVAGREKHVNFIADLLRHRMVQSPLVRERLALTKLDENRRATSEARLKRLAG